MKYQSGFTKPGVCDTLPEMNPTRIPVAELLKSRNLESLRRMIGNGGVLVYPTDTIYGMGGDFLSRSCHERIDRLKGRGESPYSAAVSDRLMMEPLVMEIPAWLEKAIPRLLPGPYTFLFKAASGLSADLLKNQAKIGIRIPDIPEILEAIRFCGVPWISTSVNRTGRPPLGDLDQICREFPGIDLVIDGGPASTGIVSTVVDVTVMPPHIIREGAGAGVLRRLLESVSLGEENGR